MIKNLVKKFLILMLLTGVPFYSYAYTDLLENWNVSPVLTGQTLNSVNFSTTQFTYNDYINYCTSQLGAGSYTFFNINAYTESTFFTSSNISTQAIVNYDFVFNTDGDAIIQFIIMCNKNGSVTGSDYSNLLADIPNDVNILLITSSVSTPPIATTTGLFGTSSMGMIANVTSGVQTTGGAVLPFVALAGLPIAFLWGRRLITFIRIASK